MEILGMSIVVASIVAAIAGLGIRNVLGFLRSNTEEPFDVRKSLASGIIGLMVGIPAIVTAFEVAFGELESLPETAQLSLFLVQVTAIAGIEAITKGGFKAAAAATTAKTK